MNDELHFRILTGILLLMAVSISFYFRLRAERHGGQLHRSEGQRLLIPLRLLGLVAIVPLLLYLIYPSWVSWARFNLPDEVRWVAAAIAFIMIPAIYSLFRVIGNNISPPKQRVSIIG